MRDQIDFDYQRGVGIYSNLLDVHSSTIKIPNRSGFLIPHHIFEIRGKEDAYLDSYLVTALLFQELHDD
jgi:hypothetical protein